VIIQAAKLRGIDINATNKAGKTALECAQSREVKPAGFVDAFQELLDNISFQDLDGTNDFFDAMEEQATILSDLSNFL